MHGHISSIFKSFTQGWSMHYFWTDFIYLFETGIAAVSFTQ